MSSTNTSGASSAADNKERIIDVLEGKKTVKKTVQQIIDGFKSTEKENEEKKGLLRRILSQRQTGNSLAFQDDYTELANRLTSIIHAFQ